MEHHRGGLCVKKVGIVFMVICFFCFGGIAEEDVCVDFDSLGGEFFSLSRLPSLEYALSLVREELSSEDVTVISIDPVLNLHIGSEQWEIAVIYQENNSLELFYAYFHVYGVPAGVRTLWLYTSQYASIADHFVNPAQQALISEQVDIWEYAYGPWFLWPLDIKTRFFTKYGVTPEDSQTWGMPDDNAMTYAQAKEAINQKVTEQYGLTLEQLAVKEDVRYISPPGRTGYWHLSYWSVIKLDGYSHWVCLFSLAEFEGEFFWTKDIAPEYIGVFAAKTD